MITLICVLLVTSASQRRLKCRAATSNKINENQWLTQAKVNRLSERNALLRWSSLTSKASIWRSFSPCKHRLTSRSLSGRTILEMAAAIPSRRRCFLATTESLCWGSPSQACLSTRLVTKTSASSRTTKLARPKSLQQSSWTSAGKWPTRRQKSVARVTLCRRLLPFLNSQHRPFRAKSNKEPSNQWLLESRLSCKSLLSLSRASCRNLSHLLEVKAREALLLPKKVRAASVILWISLAVPVSQTNCSSSQVGKLQPISPVKV